MNRAPRLNKLLRDLSGDFGKYPAIITVKGRTLTIERLRFLPLRSVRQGLGLMDYIEDRRPRKQREA